MIWQFTFRQSHHSEQQGYTEQWYKYNLVADSEEHAHHKFAVHREGLMMYDLKAEPVCEGDKHPAYPLNVMIPVINKPKKSQA